MKRTRPSSLAGAFAAAALLIGAAAWRTALLTAGDVHLRKGSIQPVSGLKLSSLPDKAGAWEKLYDAPPLSREVLEELGTSNYISRTYVRGDDESTALELHCAYYTGMVDTVPHVPERCFVGSAGMQITGTTSFPDIALDLDRFPPDRGVDQVAHGNPAQGVFIRRARTSKGLYTRLPRGVEQLTLNTTSFTDSRGATLVAGYFFVANGAVEPRAENVRFLAFRHEDTHAYFLKVQFTSSQVDTEQALAVLATDLLNSLFADIANRIPDWVDVQECRHPATAPAADSTAAP